MELKKTLLMNKGKFEMRANLPTKEPKMLKEWEKIDLYNKVRDNRDGREEFYLHEGPPYANGEIHCGHALNKILKDMINRYKALDGYKITYIPGWDTHGLPIENAVTKQGVDRKTMPVYEFRKYCMKYAYKQVEKQMKGFKRLGVLGDFANPYITLKKEYEADEVSVFADMALKGYIYKGLKPVSWSPSSECALAEAEIEYKDIPAKTIYVKFQVKDGKGMFGQDDYFTIWTTTPWTIPADLAICLNPGFTYGVFKTEKGNLIFLESFKDKLQEELGLEQCELLRTFKGQEAEYVTVKHPFYDRESLVIVGNHVTDESGTGCVHTAPGHGADDFKVCQKYKIPPLCPVDEKGIMMAECGPRLEGMTYEEANDECVKMLEETGALLKEIDIVHSYPHDWRTKKPLIFRATPQWFCSIAKFRDEALEEVDNQITYYPTWGKVRLHNMIEGREDWCISRQRAWGVPIPIIYNEDNTPIIDEKVFNHIISLIRENGSNIWFEKSAKELLPEGYTNAASPNGEFVKEKDIMDVWFDSGSSWLGVEKARGLKYPADLILEGSDQYRGWYNSSLILGVATGNKTPFKSILTHGFIVDQNGEKFSKSKGNGMTPDQINNNYGADILRLWSASIDYTMAEIKLSGELIKTVSETYRKIRNSMKFMISNLYDSKDEMLDLSKKFEYSTLDQLVLSKFDELCVNLHREYEDYDFIGVTSSVQNFLTNDLSALYLDYAKDSLYCDAKDSMRRKGIQHVLYRIVKELAIMLSPIVPFTMEEVNDNIPDKVETSIALADFPKPELDKEKLAMYNAFMNIRQKTFKKLEDARKNESLSSNSQAEVTYATNDKDELAAMKFLGTENIVKGLIVSKFSFEEKGEESIQIKQTEGLKCERCWNYFDELEEDEEGHKICPRCHQVLKDG